MDFHLMPTEEYGGMEFVAMATLNAPHGNGDTLTDYYTTIFVNRSITMAWDAGWEVYQLIDPLGAVYTMQSFSLAIDYNLTFSDLAELGSRLELPAGWSFRAVTLEEKLSHTAQLAPVLVDDLTNAYTRTHDAPPTASPTPTPPTHPPNPPPKMTKAAHSRTMIPSICPS